MSAVKMVYRLPSNADYHSQRDIKQEKIPDPDSLFHHLTNSHPNTKELTWLFFDQFSRNQLLGAESNLYAKTESVFQVNCVYPSISLYSLKVFDCSSCRYLYAHGLLLTHEIQCTAVLAIWAYKEISASFLSYVIQGQSSFKLKSGAHHIQI